MATAYALADCNNFYASAEAVFRPDWQGLPLVVCGNNDGNIIARSAAAKALGIPMGVAIHQVKPIIQQHGVIVCSANFALYGDMSSRVMDVLSRFTRHLDVYSIDEAFLDLAVVPAVRRYAYAAEMRATVRRWCGIPISIGVASTKTLAKIAAEEAKRSPEGIKVLGSDVERVALLLRMPVSDVWGIGPRRAAWLQKHEIETAYQLMNADIGWLRRHLSVTVARTALELRGVACLPLEPERKAKKQICTSRSFGQTITRLEDLREAVATFASADAAKARAQHTAPRVLTVFLATNPFRKDQAQYHPSCTVKLSAATHDTMELVRAALVGLDRIYRLGYAYHKAGVILGDFVSDEYQQGQLFEAPPNPSRATLMRTFDEINAQFGRETIRLAVTGTTRAWKMKQARRSPRYTTRWQELLRVY